MASNANSFSTAPLPVTPNNSAASTLLATSLNPNNISSNIINPTTTAPTPTTAAPTPTITAPTSTPIPAATAPTPIPIIVATTLTPINLDNNKVELTSIKKGKKVGIDVRD